MKLPSGSVDVILEINDILVKLGGQLRNSHDVRPETMNFFRFSIFVLSLVGSSLVAQSKTDICSSFLSSGTTVTSLGQSL